MSEIILHPELSKFLSEASGSWIVFDGNNVPTCNNVDVAIGGYKGIDLICNTHTAALGWDAEPVHSLAPSDEENLGVILAFIPLDGGW